MDHREGQDQGKEREARSWEDQYDKILRSSNLVRQCAEDIPIGCRTSTALVALEIALVFSWGSLALIAAKIFWLRP